MLFFFFSAFCFVFFNSIGYYSEASLEKDKDCSFLIQCLSLVITTHIID